MKKTLALLFSIVLILGLSSCTKREAPIMLALGEYVLKSEDDLHRSRIVIEEKNRFSFTIHVFSSHWPHGTYKINGNTLTLIEDKNEGKNSVYAFRIIDDALVFVEKESSAMPIIEDVPAVKDGDRFILTPPTVSE